MTIKFEIEGQAEPRVRLALKRTLNGDVVLEAGDTIVLWLQSKGTILLNSGRGDELKKMGFQVDEANRIKIEK